MRSAFSIALNTLVGFTRDKVFIAVLIFSVLLVLFCAFLSSITFIEQQKLLLDFGLAAISISGIIIAIFLGIVTVAKELEQKTIYTVIAKPISRAAYILGKFLGCVFILFIAQSIIALTLIAILLLFSHTLPFGFLTCFYLILLESILILMIAIFFSSITNSILAASLTLICFMIGRSTDTFQIQMQKSSSTFFKNIFRIFYDIFPNLNRFDIRTLVAYDKPYPEHLPFWSSIYFLFYTIFLLLIIIKIFNQKDLP